MRIDQNIKIFGKIQFHYLLNQMKVATFQIYKAPKSILNSTIYIYERVQKPSWSERSQ